MNEVQKAEDGLSLGELVEVFIGIEEKFDSSDYFSDKEKKVLKTTMITYYTIITEYDDDEMDKIEKLVLEKEAQLVKEFQSKIS